MASRSADRLRDCLLWRCWARRQMALRAARFTARAMAPRLALRNVWHLWKGPGKCEDSDSGREVEWETGTIICQQIENTARNSLYYR